MKKQNTTKIIFIGTPGFGIPSFKKLAEDDFFEIKLVVTQPDKKIGRKQILTPPPIKTEAQNKNIPVLQPEKISEIKKEIIQINPDVAIVIAYGQIIPEDILNIPKYGFVNLHASLLPKYRGAACVQAPILNNDKETGLTAMKMDKNLDTGPILSQTTIQLVPNETAGTLYEKLSRLGADFLLETLKKYITGKIKPSPQDNKKACYVKELKKEDGKINWEKTAEEIERFARAMTPWPGAFSQLRNADHQLRIKILEFENNILKINKYKPGEFFAFDKKLVVQCGQNALIIKSIQPEGKKIISGEDFIKGYKNFIAK